MRSSAASSTATPLRAAPATLPGAVRARSASACLALVVAAGAAALLHGLGGYGLWDPDEGRHAEIARELFAGPGGWRWALLTFNGAPYHDKPVLYYWLTALAYAVGGVNAAAARIVSALAGTGVLGMALWWVRREWDAATAVAAGLVLATSVEFVALGRYGDLNMLLAFWITAGVLAGHAWFARGGRGPGLLIAAAAAGCGTLTKGLVAPVLIGMTLGGYAAVRGQLRLLGAGALGRAAGVYAAVTVPWVVVAGLLDPAYIRDFVLEHHVRRFLGGPRHLHPKPALFTPLMALVAFLPWSPLLPAAIRRAVARRPPSGAAQLCAWWAGSVIVFFTWSSGKLGTYVLPAIPPLAIVTGRLLATAGTEADTRRTRRWTTAGLAAAGALSVAASAGLVWFAHTQLGGVPRAAVAVAAMLATGGAAVVLLARAGRPRPAALLVAAMTMAGTWIFYAAMAPRVSGLAGDAVLASAIRRADPHGEMPVVRFRVRGASLLFHLERPVPRIDDARALRRRLLAAPRTVVVTRPAHLAGLWPGFRRLAAEGDHAVYVFDRDGPPSDGVPR